MNEFISNLNTTNSLRHQHCLRLSLCPRARSQAATVSGELLARALLQTAIAF